MMKLSDRSEFYPTYIPVSKNWKLCVDIAIQAHQTVTSIILQMYFEVKKPDTKQLNAESKKW